MAKIFQIPYGKSTLDFGLPASIQADIAISRKENPLTDVTTAIQEALSRPFGTTPLAQLARSGNRVCIVFTDITRASPDLVSACKMIPAASMDAALRIASQDLGAASRALVVPHALLTLPVIQEKEGKT